MAPACTEMIADQLIALLEAAGQSAYFGERVTQLEHALQCAQLATDSDADEEMIIAALLRRAILFQSPAPGATGFFG